MMPARMTDREIYDQVFANICRNKAAYNPLLYKEILKALRIMDEQDHINIGRFYNLPPEIDTNLIERITYYRGRGCLFYMKAAGRFYFLPFTNNGIGNNGIDVYGRYTGISPVPFNGRAMISGDQSNPWISDLVLNPVYNIVLPDDLTADMLSSSAVILNDYSPQLSQFVQPRVQLQEPILQVMSLLVPFMRTALANSTGIEGIRVNGSDEADSVIEASRSVTEAALAGDHWVPLTTGIQSEQLTKSNALKSEEYMLAMQALDNLRLSLHGLKNGGLFRKKSHMLEAEEAVNDGNVGLILKDKIYQRQRFCQIANSIWGLGMWYEADEDLLEDKKESIMENDDSDQDLEISEEETEEGEEDVL